MGFLIKDGFLFGCAADRAFFACDLFFKRRSGHTLHSLVMNGLHLLAAKRSGTDCEQHDGNQ